MCWPALVWTSHGILVEGIQWFCWIRSLIYLCYASNNWQPLQEQNFANGVCWCNQNKCNMCLSAILHACLVVLDAAGNFRDGFSMDERASPVCRTRLYMFQQIEPPLHLPLHSLCTSNCCRLSNRYSARLFTILLCSTLSRRQRSVMLPPSLIANSC